MRLKLEAALITGTVPTDEVAKFVEAQKITWKTWLPSYAGVVSLLCFVAGLVLTGLSHN